MAERSATSVASPTVREVTPTTAALVDALAKRTAQLPESAEKAARRLVLDVLGVAIAGSATAEGRTIVAAMNRLGRPGDSPVPLGERTYDLAASALIMGTMAYSIGLTDTHTESITHPGPSVVSTALLVGHNVGATDEQILRAIVAGVEAVVRIGAVVNPSHRSRGFHPTATCNPFGTAIAASYLLGATRQQVLWSLGLAGSMAGGLYEFRQGGSMLMALHGGLPAQSGVQAAFLAAEGYSGPDTVLEGPEGFFRGYADDIRPELLLAGRPDRFGIEELGLRPYNACRYAHAGIDALQHINNRYGPVDPDDIRRVVVWTHRTAVDQESEPTTLVSARLSTCFNMALAVLRGPSLHDVSEADLRDPKVASMVERVEVREDPELTALFPHRWACRVQIETRDGTVREERVDIPKGEPENPLTEQELEDKFLRLATPVLGSTRAQRVVELVLTPSTNGALRTVVSALAAAPKGGTTP